MYKCSEKRMEDKISTFSRFGATKNGGITRYSLSLEAHLARDEFVKRMKAIGCEIVTDDFADIYAILKGEDSSLPKIVTGSHCDSVKCGGNYDGILGVMSAMEVLDTIYHEKIPHKHDIVAMIWTNEEGSLYPPAMMCSGMICHTYFPESFRNNFTEERLINSKSILDGSQTFKMALDKTKYKGEKKNRLNPRDYRAMFELHIEQGPILEANKKEIGVVTCVLGMCNYEITTRGIANHAGTTPMKYRHDALFAMAKVLLYLHENLDKLAPDLVYTTGEIFCHPNVHTVIPDEVTISLDARHENGDVIKAVKKVVESIPSEIAGCSVESKIAWERDTVYFDKKLVSYVDSAVKELGYSHQNINSGAGHDAQFVSYMLPTTMIFVPSKNGRSHCEEEYTSVKECTQGASVLLNAILKCDKE